MIDKTREVAERGPMFVSFDPNIDPAKMPRRPQPLRDDDIPFGYGGDRIEDAYWFSEHPRENFRLLTATRGDRFRAGVLDDLPTGYRAIRMSCRNRADAEFSSTEEVFVVPAALCPLLSTATDFQLTIVWCVLVLRNLVSPLSVTVRFA